MAAPGNQANTKAGYRGMSPEIINAMNNYWAERGRIKSSPVPGGLPIDPRRGVHLGNMVSVNPDPGYMPPNIAPPNKQPPSVGGQQLDPTRGVHAGNMVSSRFDPSSRGSARPEGDRDQMLAAMLKLLQHSAKPERGTSQMQWLDNIPSWMKSQPWDR